jgi:hypothetical protein
MSKYVWHKCQKDLKHRIDINIVVAFINFEHNHNHNTLVTYAVP